MNKYKHVKQSACAAAMQSYSPYIFPPSSPYLLRLPGYRFLSFFLAYRCENVAHTSFIGIGLFGQLLLLFGFFALLT